MSLIKPKSYQTLKVGLVNVGTYCLIMGLATEPTTLFILSFTQIAANMIYSSKVKQNKEIVQPGEDDYNTES